MAFSLISSAGALLAAEAAASVETGRLVTRFQEELREAVPAVPADAGEGAEFSGGAEALVAVTARSLGENRGGVRDDGRVVLFMSEEELEAAAESAALAEVISEAESAATISERLFRFNPENERLTFERANAEIDGPVLAAAAVAETPVPAAFALMLAALGLGGVVLRKARRAPTSAG
ncbi:MAG: hypothetical protein HXY23_00615 [Parvularculaceae bacterium]|jgi:hypothetical protein|nr:hypothetical protein [Parvularculaceae bacterium]